LLYRGYVYAQKWAANREKSAMLNDQTREPAASDRERAAVLLGYGLFLLAVANGVTALIGAVIAYIRRDDARGTIWESHYRNMILVFWAGLLLGALVLGLAFTGAIAAIGFAVGTAWLDDDWMFGLPLLGMGVPLVLLAGVMFGLWYLYRILRGFFRALDDKAY
jgi:uncharacterized membrane protein